MRRRGVPTALAALVALGGCGAEEPRVTERGVRRYGVYDDPDLRPAPAVPPPSTTPGAAVPSGAETPAAPAAAPASPTTASPPAPAPTAPPPPRPASSGGYEVVPVASPGRIAGVARISRAAKPWPITVDKDPQSCGTDHATERMRYGPDLGLANCVLWLEGVRKGKDWPEAMRSDERSAVIDQKTCMYVPHVQWVRRETQMVVVNSDKADHNIHGYTASPSGGTGETQFNFSSPPGVRLGDVGDAFLERAGAYLVKCDIHPWMNAYVHVAGHPYYAVTSDTAAEGRKAGEYAIEDVPPGTYVLVCWHEGMEERPVVVDGRIGTYVYGPDFVERREVTVKAGETTPADFAVPAPR
jgi:plastocyanin